MNAEAWVALAFGATGLLINLVTLAVGYGVLRGTVTALAGRVAAVESEMSALADLKVEVTRIGTRQETWIEQLKEMNASIRWMRDPAVYEPDAPGPKGRAR
jgi:hypothetical protein